MIQDVVEWSGELLWPQDLMYSRVIDCRQLVSAGSWLHDTLRAHPGVALIGLAPGVREQFQAAALPVIYYDRLSDACSGVGADERAALWSDDE